MEKLREDLRKSAKTTSGETLSQEPEAPAAKAGPEVSGQKQQVKAAKPPPSSAQPETEGEALGQPPTDSPSELSQEAETPAGQVPGKTPAKGEKISPYKLVEQYKEQNKGLQKEIADLRAAITPDTDRRTLTERAEKAEKLAQQLSDEIRYVNYEKSPEFLKEFQEPYESAFRRAMEDLSEVAVPDPNGGPPRQMTAEDLAQLAFVNFTQAKDIATKLYPDFAEDIMAWRKEIRGLWDKRQKAIESWKHNGSEREKQIADQAKNFQEGLSEFVRTNWEKANADLLADEKLGAFFKPRDGDEEWNSRLEKGKQLVDEAFATNVSDPNLTPQQRSQAIRKHAAIRNRAIAWGALRHENEQLKSQIASLQKELDEMKDSTPPTAGTDGAPTSPAQPGSARDRMFAELRKRAKPA